MWNFKDCTKCNDRHDKCYKNCKDFIGYKENTVKHNPYRTTRETDVNFDISKVMLTWDFSPNGKPCVKFAYVVNGDVWIIGGCDKSSGVVGVKELKEMWEKVVLGK